MICCVLFVGVFSKLRTLVLHSYRAQALPSLPLPFPCHPHPCSCTICGFRVERDIAECARASLPFSPPDDTVGMSVDGVLGRFPLNGLGRVIAEGEGEGDCLTHSAVLCPTLLVRFRCRRECLLCRLRVGVGLPPSPSYEVVSKVITSAV